MDSHTRHDLEDNDLATTTFSLLERLRPYFTSIAVTLAAVFTGLAAWTLVSSQRAAEKAQAWDAAIAALAARDAGRLDDVARRFPGSSAARWSQIMLADNNLAEGGRLLFVDREQGKARLRVAADLYTIVNADRPTGLAAERAVFGLAKAREGLGELEEAKRGYEALVAEHPDTPLRGLAESRIAALSRPGTPRWYAWFETQNASAAASPESAAKPATVGPFAPADGTAAEAAAGGAVGTGDAPAPE